MDVSLFDTSASMLNYLAIWNLNRDHTPVRMASSAHPSLVPSQMFSTADGYLVVMCNKEKFFPILCRALGVPHLASDARFVDFAARWENRELLFEQLVPVFRSQPNAHWLRQLSCKVPAAPVHTVGEALRHPLMAERNMVVEAGHPRQGTIRMMGTPIKMSDFAPDYSAGPSLGEHNAEIYGQWLGLSDQEQRALEADDVI